MKESSSRKQPVTPTPRKWTDSLWYLSIFVVVVVAGYSLVNKENELLWRAQELNLWLPTGLYWKTLMQYPGGTVSWCSTYLTQYFYYPWLGTSILCCLWIIICALLIWVYRLRGPWKLLVLLVPLALMGCFVQTGYWVYYQKLQGHLFVPTVGVLFAVLCLSIQRLLDNVLSDKAALWARLIWIALVCIVGYPFFGAWALGATGLLGILPPKAKGSTFNSKLYVLYILFALAFIAAVPQIYYSQLFEMTQRTMVYVAAMPSLRYGKDVFAVYRLPYYAIILAFVIIFAVSMCEGFLLTERWKQWMKSAVALLLVGAGIVGVSKVWYHDANFQKELAMYHAIEDLDWERVLRIARDGSSDVKPTRQMVMFKNLALFRLGRAGDEMFTYPEGATLQNAPWRVHMAQIGGKLVYYHYGKENFSYRWCMEDGVEFGWKAETFKLMARTSLLNQEWEVARKYLNYLKQTRFHRQWAEHYELLLKSPDAFDLEKLEASVKAGKPLMSERDLKEFAPIMHLMTYPNRLDGDNTLVEMYLMQTFAHGNGDDPLFQEQTLISALQMKDIDLFWPRFMKFATMHPTIHMPRHYQEAAYLYGHLENKVNISRMPFDPEVRDSYERFMKFNEQCGPMTEEQKAIAFYPQFGGTFYYFYFLIRNQKTN
jgi:hypothetical protein